ncbi:hypothetical protein EV122DRAFT_285577 [Schizophyllum commune]
MPLGLPLTLFPFPYPSYSNSVTTHPQNQDKSEEFAKNAPIATAGRLRRHSNIAAGGKGYMRHERASRVFPPTSAHSREPQGPPSPVIPPPPPRHRAVP